MHLHARIVGTIGVMVAMITAGLAGTAQVAAAASGEVGHVYVNDNTAGTNTIGGFDQHADGTLTAMSGSPFTAGGVGTGTIVGSQGSLQATSDGRYLLAADAGSNQISVVRVRPDGTLSPAQGSPVASGGIEPVSIAVHDGLVYVANEGNGTTGSNYTGFRLNSGGHLTPIAGSTIPLPATANPGDILFNTTGNNLIGIEVGTTDPSTFLIDSFVVGEDGRLTPAAGSPFAADTGSTTISSYAIQTDGSLVHLSDTAFSSGLGIRPFDARLDAGGNNLYVVDAAIDAVTIFSVDGGALTELASSPASLPAG